MLSFRQLYDSFVVNDTLFDDKLAELDRLATEAVERAERLDHAMCLNCGPNKPMLLQMAERLKSVRRGPRRRGACA